MTWTVNKTSQYILIIGNDSPFHVKLDSVTVTTTVPDIPESKALAKCSGIKSTECKLKVPGDVKDDRLSLVVRMDCKSQADFASATVRVKTPDVNVT